MEIHSAPIQGYTDYAYIKAHFSTIGCIDYYYTPYFSVDNIQKISRRKGTSGLSDDLAKIIIPQILPGNINELKTLISFIGGLNSSEVNINLGCPYPMATNKGRGAALIMKYELVNDFINYIHENTNLNISIKSRIGLKNNDEILNFLEKVNSSKVKNFIIHPRVASQLYKGKIHTAIFNKCLESFPNCDIIYNGDITSVDEYNDLQKLIPSQNKWMIGRGILQNPLLACQIKTSKAENYSLNNERLFLFLNDLISEIASDSNDKGHEFNRIKNHFLFLSESMPDPRRFSRLIKKTKSTAEIEYIFNHI